MSDILSVPLDPTPAHLDAVSMEFPMHRACYLADERVNAVIHTHAPALTAVGIRGIRLRDLLPEVEMAVGGVDLVAYAPSGSQALADAVGEAAARRGGLGGAGLLLLERHGALAVGRDLAEAYDRMEFAELSAKAALLAAGGTPCESP